MLPVFEPTMQPEMDLFDLVRCDLDSMFGLISTDFGTSTDPYYNDPLLPNVALQEYGGFWNQFEFGDEEFDENLMRIVDPQKCFQLDSNESLEYTPYSDHDYVKCDGNSIPCGEEEKSVDVWNRDEELSDSSVPAPAPAPPRRNVRRKAASSVSIGKAANVALKRTRWSKKLPQKKRKLDYSVETTPSSSDSEEVVNKSKNRGAKFIAIKAINSINLNTKAVKSEVQRTNHNRNEKKRREEITHLFNLLKVRIPIEFYDEETERARARASKQKILAAGRYYILHLRQEIEKSSDVDPRRLELDSSKKRKILNGLIEELESMSH